MTQFLHGWLYAVTGTAIVCALAVALTPEGRPRKITAMVCGLAMLAALISPFKTFDVTSYASALKKYEDQADDIASGASKKNDRLSRTIIEERCAAYILDKAGSQAAGLKADVTAKWNTEGYWYPYEARLSGSCGEAEKEKLAGIIEADLGIPAERQYWSDTDD